MKLLTIALLFTFSFGAFTQETGPDWVRVTEAAPWQARDSSGELVYNGRMWLFGGWFQSHEAPPRDVWNSEDGKTWTRVTGEAPWLHSDLPMTITYGDKMWLMGGWYNGRLPGHSASNEVWCSTDGATWQQTTAKAAWSPRLASALVEFKGRMFLLGGSENYYFGTAASLKNDVWSSADGIHWELLTADAGWAPRAYHQAAVLDDTIYVFGGGNYVPDYAAHNDVWASKDGKHWTCVSESAPWHSRLWFSSVVYRDHIWVMGGWSNNPSKNWGDLWYTKDGATWTQLKSAVMWRERHEHSVYLFQDKLWVAGGMIPPLNQEVWSLELPKDWPADE